MKQQSVSATELSNMAFCEYNVIKSVRPGKQDRLRMNDGIKQHNHFEGLMNRMGNSRISVPTQHTQHTSLTKTTNQGRPTFPYKTLLVLIALFVIAYVFITGTL